MNAGKYRHRIEFQKKAEQIRDPSTGIIIPTDPENEWETVALMQTKPSLIPLDYVEYGYYENDTGRPLNDIPAEVLTGPGREPYASSALQAEVTARIKCRWFPADEMEMTKWRIVWTTAAGVRRIYSIAGPPETDLTGVREWRIKCTGGLIDA